MCGTHQFIVSTIKVLFVFKDLFICISKFLILKNPKNCFLALKMYTEVRMVSIYRL